MPGCGAIAGRTGLWVRGQGLGPSCHVPMAVTWAQTEQNCFVVSGDRSQYCQGSSSPLPACTGRHGLVRTDPHRRSTWPTPRSPGGLAGPTNGQGVEFGLPMTCFILQKGGHGQYDPTVTVEWTDCTCMCQHTSPVCSLIHSLTSRGYSNLPC